jgi:aspartyl-tRNA(Asn)/glutamyl-tRNA(Gln) amidotransferase subunit A
LPQNDSGICSLSGAAQARLIRDRSLSPVEVVDAVFDRIHALEPALHAFCTLTEDAARADARAAEAAVMRGAAIGPLHGVPISIKDLICTKGIPTAAGSKAYADLIPDEDDIVVERVRAAGAIILGKTNVPEMGYSGVGQNDLFPTTRNPWNPDMTPGGSSAGSAAAVAAGMGALSIGSDGAGSIRGPSSFCGVFGVKASFGRVPLYPGCRDPRFPGLSSFESVEHLGPITRTVEDAALLLSVIAGPDDRDRHSLPEANFDWLEVIKNPDIKGLKIAYSVDFGYAKVDREVRDLTAQAARVFADSLGCEVVEDHPDLGDLSDAFYGVIMRDSDLTGMRDLADRGLITLPGLVAALAAPWTAAQFTDAAMKRQAVSNTMWRFMRRYDLLLTPTVPTPAFAIGRYDPATVEGQPPGPRDIPPFTYPFNWTGQPAVSIPAGWTQDGLPVGLQIVGGHLADALVLRAAAAYEAANPWGDRWPELVRKLGG